MPSARLPEYKTAFPRFHRYVGSTLLSIHHNLYLFNAIPDLSDLGPVDLTFDRGPVLKLELIPDGQSVTATDGPTKVIPGFGLAGHDRCDWQRTCLTNSHPYSCLAGERLARVHADVVRFTSGGRTYTYPSGWWLDFGDHRLGYHNIGDDAKLYLNCDAPDDPYGDTTRELVAPDDCG